MTQCWFRQYAARNNINGETINLGSNFEISIADTVKAIARAYGTDVTVTTENKRLRPENSEVERLWACNAKARELLNWAPKYAGLGGFEKGLQKTITWFIDETNLAKYKEQLQHLMNKLAQISRTIIDATRSVTGDGEHQLHVPDLTDQDDTVSSCFDEGFVSSVGSKFLSLKKN